MTHKRYTGMGIIFLIVTVLGARPTPTLAAKKPIHGCDCTVKIPGRILTHPWKAASCSTDCGAPCTEDCAVCAEVEVGDRWHSYGSPARYPNWSLGFAPHGVHGYYPRTRLNCPSADSCRQ